MSLNPVFSSNENVLIVSVDFASIVTFCQTQKYSAKQNDSTKLKRAVQKVCTSGIN